jgi:hypothetical protein
MEQIGIDCHEEVVSNFHKHIVSLSRPRNRKHLPYAFKGKSGPYTTLPHSHYSPSLIAQPTGDTFVPPLVLQNFVSPESYIAL